MFYDHWSGRAKIKDGLSPEELAQVDRDLTGMAERNMARNSGLGQLDQLAMDMTKPVQQPRPVSVAAAGAMKPQQLEAIQSRRQQGVQFDQQLEAREREGERRFEQMTDLERMRSAERQRREQAGVAAQKPVLVNTVDANGNPVQRFVMPDVGGKDIAQQKKPPEAPRTETFRGVIGSASGQFPGQPVDRVVDDKGELLYELPLHQKPEKAGGGEEKIPGRNWYTNLSTNKQEYLTDTSAAELADKGLLGPAQKSSGETGSGGGSGMKPGERIDELRKDMLLLDQQYKGNRFDTIIDEDGYETKVPTTDPAKKQRAEWASEKYAAKYREIQGIMQPGYAVTSEQMGIVPAPGVYPRTSPQGGPAASTPAAPGGQRVRYTNTGEILR